MNWEEEIQRLEKWKWCRYSAMYEVLKKTINTTVKHQNEKEKKKPNLKPQCPETWLKLTKAY